jgi:hypothetical protein
MSDTGKKGGEVERRRLSAVDVVSRVIFAICEVDVVLLDHRNINVQLRHRCASAPAFGTFESIIISKRVQHNA